MDTDKAKECKSIEIQVREGGIFELVPPAGFHIEETVGKKFILVNNPLPANHDECLNEYSSQHSVEYITSEAKVRVVQKGELFLPDVNKSVNDNVLPLGYAKKVLTLQKLLLCRETYRRGWKPKKGEYTYQIVEEGLNTGVMKVFKNKYPNILSFQDESTAKLFKHNFINDILEVKDLLYGY